MSKREKTSTMSSFDDLLQCSVCLERFTTPKVLPCQHTFCLSCLKGIIKDAETLDCPTCRKTHQVPEQGATGFLDNLVIVNLLDMVKETAACSDCGEKQTLSDCEHCGEELCADCRVAHNRLETRLSMLLNLILNSLRNKSNAGEEIARAELERIFEAEANIHKAFDEAMEAATATLTKRRDELLHKLQTLAKFQKAIVENQEEVVVCTTRCDLRTLLSICSLEEMEKSLSMVEEMMSKVALDLNDVGKFDEVNFDGEILTGETKGKKPANEIASSKVLSGSTAASNVPVCTPEVAATGGRFPANVEYKAKQPLWKLIIATPAEGCEEFKPTYAVYSPLEDAMYCLSDGKILRYDAKTGVGKIVCGIFEAKHMAFTHSGSVVLVDEKHIVKITADRLENLKEEAFTFVLANLPAGTKATQICCYGKEVVVLDAGNDRLLKFNEAGQLMQEIKSEKLKLDENSRMCVDDKGLIYVTDRIRIKRRVQSSTVNNSCQRQPVSVTILLEQKVAILNWDETEFSEVVVGGYREKYDYDKGQSLPYKCGHFHEIRDRSRVTDERILADANSRAVSGLCVDADGYICTTRREKNQIDVHDPKGQLHCTIGYANNSEFKEPTGLSLMPDGRLVVCDTGNNRIQIM